MAAISETATTKSLKKQSLISMFVLGLPSVVGLVCVPLLIKNLGLERFAFLSIVWSLIGYFGIFDLGLGRSLNKRAAARLALNQMEDLNKDLQLGFSIIVGMGLLIAFSLFFFGDILLSKYYKIESGFIAEALNSVFIVSISVPVLMLLSALKGVFEGLHQFRRANLIHLFNGLANYIIPTIYALYFSKNIREILTGLFVFRLVLFLLSLFWLRTFFKFAWPKHWDKTLLQEGGWITVASLASPILIYVDRLVLGAIVPLKNLSYYTTSVDLASRAWIIPQAITRITFPRFSYLGELKKKSNSEEMLSVFSEAIDLMILACFIPLLFLFAYSSEIFRVWINVDMATNASSLLRLLCVGLFFNCLSWVTQSYMQATSMSAQVGFVAMLEIPFYFVALWFAAKTWGLPGAALVWSIRLILDAIAMDLVCYFKEPFFLKTLLNKFIFGLVFLVACFSILGIERLAFSSSTYQLLKVALGLLFATGIVLTNQVAKGFLSRWFMLKKGSFKWH